MSRAWAGQGGTLGATGVKNARIPTETELRPLRATAVGVVACPPPLLEPCHVVVIDCTDCVSLIGICRGEVVLEPVAGIDAEGGYVWVEDGRTFRYLR
jgi:hypothetical protein